MSVGAAERMMRARGAGAVDLVAGWTPIDREAVLHAVVSGGGMMLLAYAGWARATDRATAAQVRALVAAGIGFLMSAGASIYLRDHEALGGSISLAGCAVVVGATRTLLRERIERNDAERRRASRPPAGE